MGKTVNSLGLKKQKTDNGKIKNADLPEETFTLNPLDPLNEPNASSKFHIPDATVSLGNTTDDVNSPIKNLYKADPMSPVQLEAQHNSVVSQPQVKHSSMSKDVIGEIRISDEHSHVLDLTEQLKIKFNTGQGAHNPSTLTLGQMYDGRPLITNEQLQE